MKFNNNLYHRRVRPSLTLISEIEDRWIEIQLAKLTTHILQINFWTTEALSPTAMVHILDGNLRHR